MNRSSPWRKRVGEEEGPFISPPGRLGATDRCAPRVAEMQWTRAKLSKLLEIGKYNEPNRPVAEVEGRIQLTYASHTHVQESFDFLLHPQP